MIPKVIPKRGAAGACRPVSVNYLVTRVIRSRKLPRGVKALYVCVCDGVLLTGQVQFAGHTHIVVK